VGIGKSKVGCEPCGDSSTDNRSSRLELEPETHRGCEGEGEGGMRGMRGMGPRSPYKAVPHPIETGGAIGRQERLSSVSMGFCRSLNLGSAKCADAVAYVRGAVLVLETHLADCTSPKSVWSLKERDRERHEGGRGAVWDYPKRRRGKKKAAASNFLSARVSPTMTFLVRGSAVTSQLLSSTDTILLNP
jgi:hypothetical protein